MTQNGQPDNPRSARYVLKDFVNGKLLYCVAPPTVEQEYFHTFPLRRRELSNRCIPPRAARINKGIRTTIEDLDRVFFQDKLSGVHVKRIFDKGPQYSSSMYVRLKTFALFVKSFVYNIDSNRQLIKFKGVHI